jgi:hypothetical protein
MPYKNSIQCLQATELAQIQSMVGSLFLFKFYGRLAAFVLD